MRLLLALHYAQQANEGRPATGRQWSALFNLRPEYGGGWMYSLRRQWPQYFLHPAKNKWMLSPIGQAIAKKIIGTIDQFTRAMEQASHQTTAKDPNAALILMAGAEFMRMMQPRK
jgi:hypothetical protein